MVAYLAPYTYKEIVDSYGKATADRLAKDPAHKFRMDTGIELIHQEPSLEELERIYANYRLMPNNLKRQSNAKSKELFGVTNIANYKQLRKRYLQ